MDEVSKKFLMIFRKFNVGKEEFLSIQKIKSITFYWDRGDQDKIPEAISYLISENYIKKSESSYVLLEKGYKYLYPEIRIEYVASEILEIFKDLRIGKNEILMFQKLQLKIFELKREYRDKATEALKWLVSLHLIELADIGYKLLERGYHKIYH